MCNDWNRASIDTSPGSERLANGCADQVAVLDPEKLNTSWLLFFSVSLSSTTIQKGRSQRRMTDAMETIEKVGEAEGALCLD